MAALVERVPWQFGALRTRAGLLWPPDSPDGSNNWWLSCRRTGLVRYARNVGDSPPRRPQTKRAQPTGGVEVVWETLTGGSRHADPSGGDRVVRAGAVGMSVTLARLGEVFVITWRLKDQSSGEGFLEAPELRHACPSGVYWFLRSRSGKTEDEALVNEVAQRSIARPSLSSWEASRIFCGIRVEVEGMPVPQRPRKYVERSCERTFRVDIRKKWGPVLKHCDLGEVTYDLWKLPPLCR